MQPHEKKMKPSVGLKSIHLEHCGRLQQKYQQDAELLEDIRFFLRQRSIIEKVYAQSLQKLAQQLIAKRQSSADKEAVSYNEQKPNKRLVDVWKTVLEETEKVGKVRLVAAEDSLQTISDECKQVRMGRCQAVKTVLERLGEIQKEVTLTVQELNKAQKLYRDEQHLTNDARLKAANADTKLKNRSTSRFTSLSKLQQQSSKCNTRWESCETKSTEARNEYLLNLAATNAHLLQYYNVDMPELLTVLDGDYYEKVQESLLSLAHMELSCSEAVRVSFAVVTDDAAKISRDYDLGHFLQEKPILTTLVQYEFEPQDNDQMTGLSSAYGGELVLSREARKWSAKLIRETRTIRATTKELNKLLDHGRSTKTIDSSLSLDAKIEDLRNVIRKAETAKQRAEARLELLRSSGVNVDEWMNGTNIDEDEEADAGVQSGRCSPTLSTKSDSSDHEKSRTASSPVVVPLPNRRTSLDAVYAGEVRANIEQERTVSEPEPIAEEEYTAEVASYPVWCVALYDYKAAHADELTIYEDDSLEIVGTGDCDGWLKARNSNGDEGFVPENYIRIWNPVDDVGENGGNELNVDDDTNEDTMLHVPVDVDVNGGNIWARALFDYEATCDEELTFTEGQLILVQSKEHDGVDDGWWIGVLNGIVGVFPSLMVEELLPLDEKTSENVTGDEELNDNDSATAMSRSFESDALNHRNQAVQSLAGSAYGARSVLDLQYLFTDGTESSV